MQTGVPPSKARYFESPLTVVPVNQGVDPQATNKNTAMVQIVRKTDPDRIAIPAQRDRSVVQSIGRRALLLGSVGVGILGAAGTALTFRPWQVIDKERQKLNQEAAPRRLTASAVPPPWLATMRELTGTQSRGKNAMIQSWASKIGELFPEMASYSVQYTTDDIPWSGLVVAYCMAVNGIKPIFGATDTDKFLWIDAWARFGTSVSTPEPATCSFSVQATVDVPLHFTRRRRATSYLCRGGRGDQVKLLLYAKNECRNIQRPPVSTIPAWLATMRQITGTQAGNNNPTILGWAKKIGELFPEMATYSAQYRTDEMPWSGLVVAYCMAVNGIKPIFGATDTDKFLWNAAWARFGTPASAPGLGDVLLFNSGGGTTIALYEKTLGAVYLCRGFGEGRQVKDFAARRTSARIFDDRTSRLSAKRLAKGR